MNKICNIYLFTRAAKRKNFKIFDGNNFDDVGAGEGGNDEVENGLYSIIYFS